MTRQKSSTPNAKELMDEMGIKESAPFKVELIKNFGSILYKSFVILFALFLTSIFGWLGYEYGLRATFVMLPELTYFKAFLIRVMLWGFWK